MTPCESFAGRFALPAERHRAMAQAGYFIARMIFATLISDPSSASSFVISLS